MTRPPNAALRCVSPAWWLLALALVSCGDESGAPGGNGGAGAAGTGGDQPARSISGTVSGDTGLGFVLPLGNAHVCAERNGSPATAEEPTAADGSFALALAPGGYRLRAGATGYQELLSDELDVTADSLAGVELVLQLDEASGLHTVGGVVDDGTAPVADARVTLRDAADGSALADVLTLPDGWYAFTGVADGSYELDAGKEGFRPAAVGQFAIDENARIDITLTPELIDTFRFAVQSDMHVYRSGAVAPGLKRLIRGTIEYVQPSFVLLSGDMTSGTASDPTDEPSVNYYWDSFFAAIDGYLPAQISFFPSRGNHDYYNSAQQTVYGQRWGEHQVEGVPIVGDTTAYYSFDFGNSHFSILAGNSTSLGQAQMDWLRTDLTAAASATHRFVVSHVPLVSEMQSPHGVLSGSTSDGVPLGTVLGDGHIHAIFTGHEHCYVDHPEALPGVRQVACGTAAGTYNYPLADGSTQELVPSMVVVDVAGDEVSIYGARDAPEFSTTWDGAPIAAPPPRRIGWTAAPVADILVVDGWQRGRLDERAELRARGLAMFDGLSGLSAVVVSQAAVASGLVHLGRYDVVVYLLSNEGEDDLSFSLREQQLVGDFVAGGGRLVVSGSETGYDLVSAGGGPDFYPQVLGASFIADDAGTGNVAGVAATPFDGLSASFAESVAPYQYPDVIAPLAGSETLVRYSTGQDAAIGTRAGAGGVIYFAFAIDGLGDEAARRAFAAAALAYLGVPAGP